MAKQINQDTLLGDVLYEWTIQEYEQYARNVWWYIVMITAGLVLVLYGIFSGNFLFSLIIVLFAIIMFLQSHQTPPQVAFQITEFGIVVGNRFYKYSELINFYIIYNPPHTKSLFVETKSNFKPLLRIPLLDINPIEVRHTLREYLEEDLEKEEEPISEAFARNWRIH
jgi:hypothetical protein